LGEILSAADRRETFVVFDARNAPVGTPRQTEYCGLTVRFAAGYEEADNLLEELIEDHPAPHTLTVVSGDRRIQRAARRRKARAIDSDAWYAEQSAADPSAAVAQRPALRPTTARRSDAEADARGKPPLLPDDVFAWLAASDAGDVAEPPPESAGGRSSSTKEPKSTQSPQEDAKDGVEPFDSPFPPGYGEDLELE
jgi:uncharacterized protein